MINSEICGMTFLYMDRPASCVRGTRKYTILSNNLMHYSAIARGIFKARQSKGKTSRNSLVHPRRHSGHVIPPLALCKTQIVDRPLIVGRSENCGPITNARYSVCSLGSKIANFPAHFMKPCQSS